MILERDTKGFRPDWHNNGQSKWVVYYDWETGALVPTLYSIFDFGCIAFPDSYTAEESTEAHRKWWLTYLGVEDND